MKRGKTGFLILSILLLSSIVAAGLSGQAARGDNLYRNLSLFSEVISLVDRNYVDEVSREELIEGAFLGVTDAIDEFSYYVPPSDVALYTASEANDIGGAGLVVSKRLGYAYVISVIDGSPAAEAGVEPGDFIERVNGELTTDMPVWKIRSALQWERGDRLDLVVVRSGLTERDEMSIARRDYDMPGVSVEYADGYAIVDLPVFAEGTAEAFRSALEEIGSKEIGKIVIDLRGNAAGAYAEAIAAADHLLAEGTIAALEGRRVEEQVWTADAAVSFEGDVVVLIDNSTAAGAEIFASAISRNERGQTVGIPTYGRAIEQKFVLLPSGGGLNITVAHYAGPTGESIMETGVRPDVAVNRAALVLNEQNGEDAEDLILKRGIGVLTGTAEKS